MATTGVSVRLDLGRIPRDLNRNSQRAIFLLTQQVLKDSNKYIPADTWTLRNSSLTSSNFQEGKVVWNTPYAKKVYYGSGINFSKDKNMLAQSMWFEKAQSIHQKEWNKLTKKAMTGDV